VMRRAGPEFELVVELRVTWGISSIAQQAGSRVLLLSCVGTGVQTNVGPSQDCSGSE
jgi:hypothetical protein